LKTLKSKFENTKMRGNKSLNDYITKMKDLVHQMRSLREDITKIKMLNNILRSVMSKFEMIATSILVSLKI
jgi:hypothetical protein